MTRLAQLLASLLAAVALAFTAAPAGASGIGGYGPAAAAARIAVSVSINPATGVVTLTVTGGGFGSSQTISLTLYSTPQSLGTVQTNGSGSLADAVTLPAGVPAGNHTLVATDQATGQTASAPFTLAQASGPFTTGAPAGPSTPSAAPGPNRQLPITGADVATLSALAALSIALGGFMVLGARRRRHHNWVS